MTFATQPGQTIFIAQFNASLRETFGLSHGAFGALYTIATLASATALVWAGGLADRLSPRRLAAFSMAGLAAMALLMAAQQHVAMLVLALAGLRFFGQGMLAHVAMTTMSRWFNRFRGRALSIAGLGFTLGEASLPFTMTLAIAAFGWRQVWVGTALVLLAVMLPLIAFLLRDPPDGKRALASGQVNPDGATPGAPTGAGWTRGAVLRDPLFYAIIPGIMGPPAIGTLFIFHQAHLVAIKGWDLVAFTALFPVLSATVVLSALAAGVLVDRFGAWRLMRFILLPQAVGSLVIATLAPQWTIPVFFICFGMTSGMLSPVLGALWAELYGTAHLGAIRALATAAVVAASAIGPGLAGLLVDAGIELDVQGFGYAAYSLAGVALYFVLQRPFRRRAATVVAHA
ncbi:MAG TPA: MFS transporter [Devosiaceae bacterium]|nr:MFS transporter [Devosiaceae bacterium]